MSTFKAKALLTVATTIAMHSLCASASADATLELKSPPGEIVFDASTGKYWKHDAVFYDGQTVTLRVVNLNMYEKKYTLTMEGQDTYNFDMPSALNTLILRKQPATAALPPVEEGFTSGSIEGGPSGSLLPASLLVLYANFQIKMDNFESTLVEKDGNFGKGLALDLVNAVKLGNNNADIKAKVLNVVSTYSAAPAAGQRILLNPELRAELDAHEKHYKALATASPGSIPNESPNIHLFVKKLSENLPGDVGVLGSPQAQMARIQTAHDEYVEAAQNWRTGVLRWNLTHSVAASAEGKFKHNQASLLRLLNATTTPGEVNGHVVLSSENIPPVRDFTQLGAFTQFQTRYLSYLRLKQLRSNLVAVNAAGTTETKDHQNVATELLSKLDALTLSGELDEPARWDNLRAGLKNSAIGKVLSVGDAERLRYLQVHLNQSESLAENDFLKQVNDQVTAVNAAVDAVVKFDEDNLTKRLEYLEDISKGVSQAGQIFLQAVDPATLPVTATRVFVIGKADSVKATVKVEQVVATGTAEEDKDTAKPNSSTVSFVPSPSDTPTSSMTRSISVNVVGRSVLDYSIGLIRTDLKKKNWAVTNGTVQNAPSERNDIGTAALAHYYKTSKSSLFPALTLGIGNANDTRLLGGVSLGYRKNNTRLYLTYGAAYGKVSELTNQKVGDTATAVNTTTVNRSGQFVGATFNLSF